MVRVCVCERVVVCGTCGWVCCLYVNLVYAVDCHLFSYLFCTDPFYWYWLPMAKKPFSEESVSTYLPKLQDEGFVEGLVEDIRNLFKVLYQTFYKLLLANTILKLILLCMLL